MILKELQGLESKLDFAFLESLACRIEYSEVSHQSIARSATESRSLRGAEIVDKGGSSASARLELEAEERGTPLDCRKSGDFFGVKGSGEGINPFLRKEIFLNNNTESNKDTLLMQVMTEDLNTLLDSLPTPPKEGWECKNLREIAEISRGASPRPISKFLTDSNDGINWIKIGDVAQGLKYITQTKEKITQEGANKSKRVKAGDFILSNSMSVGRPYILKIDGCIHDGWLLLSNIDQTINKEFLYYALTSNDTQEQFKQKASGMVVENLNIDLVKSVKIPLPPLAAQEKIVEVIENIEAKIATIDSKISTLESQKAEILNNVLSGGGGKPRSLRK